MNKIILIIQNKNSFCGVEVCEIFQMNIVLEMDLNRLFVASKLYGAKATIIIFVFVLYCILLMNA